MNLADLLVSGQPILQRRKNEAQSVERTRAGPFDLMSDR